MSVWEIAIKLSLGKLKLREPFDDFIAEQMTVNGFVQLEVEYRHVVRVAALPFYHRDPFDRLLVAQAATEKLVLVSADAAFDAYGVERTW